MNEVLIILRNMLLLFNEVGTTPLIVVLVAIFVLPPLLHVWVIWKLVKGQLDLKESINAKMVEDNKRFEQLISNMAQQSQDYQTKYDNNALLVKNYENLAGDLTTIIHLNTTAMTRAIDRIDGREGRRTA